MNYVLQPSLEHLAAIKVAHVLWDVNDIKTLMVRYSQISCNDKEKWLLIENKVLEKIPHLSLSIDLEEKLVTFVKMTGLQILPWLEYTYSIYFRTDLPQKFCWTLQGKINCKKTAKMLIEDDTINVASRFMLACIYCFRDDVLKLWNKLPENRRKAFYQEKDRNDGRQHNLVLFWVFHILNETDKLLGNIAYPKLTPYQHALEFAYRDGITAAVQYFLPKLTPRERNKSLFRYTYYLMKILPNIGKKLDLHTGDCMDTFCFLLMEMHEILRLHIYNRYSYEVLNCFLQWPVQGYFMKWAKRLLEFLSVYKYEKLLQNILHKALARHRDYNYDNLFEEFCRLGDEKFGKLVTRRAQMNASNIISKLFISGKVEDIRSILQSKEKVCREIIIFDSHGKTICENLITDQKWDLLKFFISECIASKHGTIQFKKEFKKHVECKYAKQSAQSKKLDKFYQLVDELIEKFDKID